MPEDQAIGLITSTWRTAVDAYIAKLRFGNEWYIVPGLAVIGATVVGFLIGGPLVPVVVFLIGAAIVFALGYQKKKKADAQVDAAEAARAAATADSVLLYRDAVAQLVDARLLYAELDEQESDVLGLIASWPTIDHAMEATA